MLHLPGSGWCRGRQVASCTESSHEHDLHSRGEKLVSHAHTIDRETPAPCKLACALRVSV